jgi:hypothetical protein
VVVVAALLCLGIANISARATSHAVEDGVLWKAQPEGVIAADVAPGTGASAADIRRGDVLIAIDGRPVQQVADIESVLRAAKAGQSARYTVLRLGSQEVVDLRIAPIPSGPRVLYYFLAAVGIFTLLIGAAVRLRRPARSGDAAFFLVVRRLLRRLYLLVQRPARSSSTWVFYLADASPMLSLPPALLHFTLVFPS